MPKKRRKRELPRLSPKDRFTDLLFPETKGTEEWGEERKEARKKAKAKLSYWISLGEPLARMTQRFGYSILLRLPAKLTDKDLHYLPRPQIQDFLDYIDWIHPGLKEQASKLSDVLPHRIDAKSSPQRLVLDKLISNLLPELRNRKMEELFQFTNDPVDFGPNRAVVGPLIDQAHANNQLAHPQRTRKPGQSIRVDYSSQSPQWKPPSAGIKDGDPYHGKSDYPQEPDQQRNRYQDSPSSFQDDNWSAQSESGHTWGSPESQDYYSQDDDWRAEPQPGDYEGEVPDSQYG
ncbi:hypothetical protein B0J14DRAFT_675784 [Halenospora varia]|nr:hypothetical protein B0J14DRAFT_675784 [Halenospora varia]